MGVLNVTPDSFSDGGTFMASGVAIAHAKQMVADGCDIVDVGGESTRPGATPLDAPDELARIEPI
ncbi:MAG: dihydropteroate synthase, partial [Xanthobacteraceae bacterium]